MEEMLTQLFNSLLAWADSHGAWAGLSLTAGIMLGPKAVPALRRIAGRTPTRIDDMAVDALDLLITRKQSDIERFTAAELERIVSTPVLCELVRLRKARLAEQKTATAAKGAPA